MRAAIAVVVMLASACKTDDAKPAAPAVREIKPMPTPRPAAPAPEPEPPAPPATIDAEHVKQVAPHFEHATELAPLTIQDAYHQARTSYCIAAPTTGDAAKQLAATLAREGWDAVSSRADDARASISASQGGMRIAITIGGTAKGCTGKVANVLYSGEHPTIPELAPGERVH